MAQIDAAPLLMILILPATKRHCPAQFARFAPHGLISLKPGSGPAPTIRAEEIVRLAVFTDIHANRPAFSACLDFARSHGADKIICLGDYVGYGADPEWTVETVMGLVEQGAMAVRGNHDQAVGTATETMNAEAQAAIEWTRGRLSAPQRRFLDELPLTLTDEDRLYVHSEASQPAKWRYVQSTSDAGRSMLSTDAAITFCGHIHRPALYSMSATAKMSSFIPSAGVTVPLLRGRRWLAVIGSVGQPRDGDPAAAFAMYDTVLREMTYCRVPYHVEAAARRIYDNGLPAWLADRLWVGR
jgi:diadenosine tetraphosphatase ApaH/serine/threonine PP2A family protein phosphatase